MKHKGRILNTIQGRLILCFTGIFVFVIVIFSLFFADIISDTLEKRATESLQQLSVNTSGTLDAAIRELDNYASRIISSNLIKDTFYLRGGAPAEELDNKRSLIDLLFTVTGTSIDTRLNLIQDDGTFAQYGQKYDIYQQNPDFIRSLEWFQETLAREGSPYLTSPRATEWSDSGETVISVCRAFNSSFGAPYDAVVEVVYPFERFEASLSAATVLLDEYTAPVSAYVFTQDGRQLYPYPAGKADAAYFRLAEESGASSGTFPLRTDTGSYIAAYARSPHSGLRIVLSEKETDLLAPLKHFQIRLALVSAVMLLVTVLLISLLSRQLTNPIRSIRQAINELDLNDLSSDSAAPYAKGTAYELTRLQNSYVHMVERLQSSLTDTVTARSHEVEARMLALQAQMNPHFLYNAITIISIKAENNGDDAVVSMCENLSSMLRYITKDTSGLVPLSEELSYLKQYLSLMECRYPDGFGADICIPADMDALLIPKLTIQPLVENSFKHGFVTSGDWHIAIRGEMDAHMWRISVQDNGCGFSGETLDSLRRESVSSVQEYHSEGRENIGLCNILYRLKIRYKTDFMFEVENLAGGGCLITIGGRKETE